MAGLYTPPPPKPRPGLLQGLFEFLAGFVQAFRRGREVTHLNHFLVHEGEVEVQEGRHLGFLLDNAGVAVKEQRAGQGVGAGVDGFRGGRDAVDGDVAHFVFVLEVVGESEVGDGVGAAGHTLGQHVVVFAQLQVGGVEEGLLLLAEYLFHEIVEGAAVRARGEALDLLGRPGGVHIRPQGGRAEQLGQLFLGDIFDEGVLLAQHNGQGAPYSATTSRGPSP